MKCLCNRPMCHPIILPAHRDGILCGQLVNPQHCLPNNLLHEPLVYWPVKKSKKQKKRKKLDTYFLEEFAGEMW